MKALRITGCTDSMMWYSKRVGQLVPYLRTHSDCYMSLEPAGYKNIVHLKDAEIVEVTEDEFNNRDNY